MKGHWQREVPTRDGQYWTADMKGRLAGTQLVAYHPSGRLLYAGGAIYENPRLGDNRWLAWWWSEPVETPPLPDVQVSTTPQPSTRVSTE